VITINSDGEFLYMHDSTALYCDPSESDAGPSSKKQRTATPEPPALPAPPLTLAPLPVPAGPIITPPRPSVPQNPAFSHSSDFDDNLDNVWNRRKDLPFKF
jgi:hypothetical protein